MKSILLTGPTTLKGRGSYRTYTLGVGNLRDHLRILPTTLDLGRTSGWWVSYINQVKDFSIRKGMLGPIKEAGRVN